MDCSAKKKLPQKSRRIDTVAVPLFAEGLSVYPWHRTPFCPKISIFSIMRLLQPQHNNIIEKAHSAILSREFCRCWYLFHRRQRKYLFVTWLHRWKCRRKSSSFSSRYVWSSAICQEMTITAFSRHVYLMIYTSKRNLKCAAWHEVWLILKLTPDMLSQISAMLQILDFNCRASGLFALDKGIKVRRGSICRLKRNMHNLHG